MSGADHSRAPAEPELVVERTSLLGRLTMRLAAARQRIRDVPGGAIALRIVVTLVGLFVMAVGLLLLPLPGPGWLIIFAGMGILATEYAWAARLLHRTRAMVRRWTQWSLRQSTAVRLLIGVVGVAFLAALAVGSFLLVG